MTRNGIETDPLKSPYWADAGHLRYWFSSQLYRDKFAEEYPERFHKAYVKLRALLIDPENYTDALTASIYAEIEKRIFYCKAMDDAEEYLGRDNIKTEMSLYTRH